VAASRLAGLPWPWRQRSGLAAGRRKRSWCFSEDPRAPTAALIFWQQDPRAAGESRAFLTLQGIARRQMPLDQREPVGGWPWSPRLTCGVDHGWAAHLRPTGSAAKAEPAAWGSGHPGDRSAPSPQGPDHPLKSWLGAKGIRVEGLWVPSTTGRKTRCGACATNSARSFWPAATAWDGQASHATSWRGADRLAFG